MWVEVLINTLIVTGTTQPIGNFQPPNVFSVCGSNPITNNPKFTFTINGLCSNRVNCDVIPTQTATQTPTPTPTPTSKYVYVFESCVAIDPNISSQLTQIIQDSPLSFTLNPNFVFKDKNGVCWRYVGRFGSNYIPPANVSYSTQSGNYFVGASNIYANCTDCLTAVVPCTRPANLNKYNFVSGIRGTTVTPNVPIIYDNFRTSNISLACDAWNWAVSHPNSVRGYSLEQIEVSSLTVGSRVYRFFNQTSCTGIQTGNYWVQTVNNTATFPGGYDLFPNVLIVTIGNGSLITNIQTCYGLP
jgi:hypothetical protein